MITVYHGTGKEIQRCSKWPRQDLCTMYQKRWYSLIQLHDTGTTISFRNIGMYYFNSPLIETHINYVIQPYATVGTPKHDTQIGTGHHCVLRHSWNHVFGLSHSILLLVLWCRWKWHICKPVHLPINNNEFRNKNVQPCRALLLPVRRTALQPRSVAPSLQLIIYHRLLEFRVDYGNCPLLDGESGDESPWLPIFSWLLTFVCINYQERREEK